MEYIETLFSYSSSVTIRYVYSMFVEKNAMSVEYCTQNRHINTLVKHMRQLIFITIQNTKALIAKS
ncbi:hypothetical protein THF5H11_11429 [Vibrio jasicida]|nr:hypothetical protein THF5H11_11429 [Vibrio jasicida]